jgi:hypothetical protein
MIISMNKPNRFYLKNIEPRIILLFFFLVGLSLNIVSAQVGLGAQAVVNHPGLLKSDKNNIHFEPGVGYGFFVRHDVYDSSAVNLDVRYGAVLLKHRAGLPNGENAKYNFSDFSIELLLTYNHTKKTFIYGGIGVGLLSLISEDRIRATYTDQSFYPVFFAGWGYNWATGFDLFLELKGGLGSTEAGPETIPVSGASFNFGLTMYLTE